MSETKPVAEKKEPQEPTPAAAPSEPAPMKPTSEKPTETTTTTEIPTATGNDTSSDYIGKRISKKFGSRNYFGEIKDKWQDEKDSTPKWSVKYDDGDEEDFNEKQVTAALKRYAKSKRFDFKIFPRKPRTPGKKREAKPPPPRTNKYPKRGDKK
mmetsp:Transcript_16659/g.38454  ORF Transcript_16659/g.38454 Transcript_16659/m.38454 type:complete len:154 (+) Transcript_16659:212-673(+)